jgi:hypothetical protein
VTDDPSRSNPTPTDFLDDALQAIVEARRAGDPLARLRALTMALGSLDEAESQAVQEARAQGHDWDAVGKATGLRLREVWRRFQVNAPERLSARYQGGANAGRWRAARLRKSDTSLTEGREL